MNKFIDKYASAMKKLFYLLAGLAVLTIAAGCNGRLDDEDYYVENPNWYVEYDGRTVYPDHSYVDYVRVTVTAGHESYLVGWVTVAELEEMGISGAVGYWTDIYAEWLDALNDNPYGEVYDWDYYSYTGSNIVEFSDDFKTDQPCVAFIFSVYSWGTPTGSYAVSEPFYPGQRVDW